MIFTALLAFLISVILNRLRIDISVIFAVAAGIPAVLTLLMFSGHVASLQEGIELLVVALICSAIAAALGFLFRKKSARPEGESKESTSK